MKPLAYYNEHDAYAAEWLRRLIAAGHIAQGEVDERSIVDVRAADLGSFTQCHFFAGIGVWSYALRQAGWPDDRQVWTGSCPCQPFSAAGAGDAFDDERDLWPAWFPLIRERRPRAVFGEQVASPLGLAWLDAVHADLEAASYTVGAVDTCAAGFGAPHIRQRLYFVADTERRAPERHGLEMAGAAGRDQGAGDQRQRLRAHPRDGGDAGELDDPEGGGRRIERPAQRPGPAGHHDLPGGALQLGDADVERREGSSARPRAHRRAGPERHGEDGALADAQRDGGRADLEERRPQGREADGRPGPTNGFWRGAEWIFCTDGKARPVEPGTFPLAHGVKARVGRLRAYGNAINAEAAIGFIQAYDELRRAA